MVSTLDKFQNKRIKSHKSIMPNVTVDRQMNGQTDTEAVVMGSTIAFSQIEG